MKKKVNVCTLSVARSDNDDGYGENVSLSLLRDIFTHNINRFPDEVLKASFDANEETLTIYYLK